MKRVERANQRLDNAYVSSLGKECEAKLRDRRCGLAYRRLLDGYEALAWVDVTYSSRHAVQFNGLASPRIIQGENELFCWVTRKVN
jgi:hypothetical protein